jgi:hypothetical protein
MDYVQKKRRVDSLEITPQAQRLPSGNQLEGVPHESDPVNTNLATRSPQAADAQTQTKSEISNSESATDRSSDIGDSEDNHHGGYSDDDDDDDPLHSVDSPQHKLDLLHMLGYDTPESVQFTTNICGGVGSSSGSGSASGNSNNSGSGKAAPSSATTNSSGSWTPGTQLGTASDTKSPGDNIVAIRSSIPPLRLAFKPLELKCWHAACGFRCPGNKTGTSTEVRRLMEYVLSNHSYANTNQLSDHSFSKKSSNHHKLPPKCQRCDRLFENEDLAEQHKDKLKSDVPCNILPPEELEDCNSELNRKGISPDRKNKIDNAIRSFIRNGTLPAGHEQIAFKAWISRNRPIYVGRSDISSLTADRELGKWFVVWYTLFPDKEIPYHPCK